MAKKVTQTGFEYEIEDEVFDDWEIMELIEQIEDGNPLATIKLAKLLLGKEQYEQLKAHCTKDGRVRSSLVMAEVKEIFDNSDVKN